MKDKTSGVLTLDDIMALPDRVQWLEAIAFMEAHENDWIFPEKDVAAYKSVLRDRLRKQVELDPDLPLKDAIEMALAPLPDSLAGKWVREIVRFAIEQWEVLVSEQFAEVAA